MNTSTTSSSARAAIVTGASRGIGRAIALRLAADGFKVVVNYSGNSAKADEVIGLLAKCVDPFPLENLYVAQSPASAMTGWLAEDEAPANFSIDQDTELRSSGESGAAIRYVKHSIDADDVRRHIQSGKQCTRLAMTWADRISFVLTEGLDVKRVAPLDVLKEAFKDFNDDDAPRLGAALAYYTIFSIAPLLLISIAVAGLVFGQDAAQGRIVAQLQGLVGAEAAHTIQGMIQSARKPDEGIVATETFMGFLDGEGRFGAAFRCTIAGRSYVVVQVDGPDGPLWVGFRKLGQAKLKGLDPLPVFEVLDAGQLEPSQLERVSEQGLLRATEREYTAGLSHRGLA